PKSTFRAGANVAVETASWRKAGEDAQAARPNRVARRRKGRLIGRFQDSQDRSGPVCSQPNHGGSRTMGTAEVASDDISAHRARAESKIWGVIAASSAGTVIEW